MNTLFDRGPLEPGKRVDDKPVEGKVETVSAALSIVCHPAFRIGFLDAMAGKPFDHDKIMARIIAETPDSALRRIKWDQSSFLAAKQVELAQYRYEEGRLLFLEYRLKVKGWGHPDFPPAAVVQFCRDYVAERKVAA